MNVAYGWAFFNPVRKIYYNLAITGLSVAICFFIGTIEVLGILPHGAALARRLLALHVGLQHQHRRLHHRRRCSS
jgi:high-affinity nickel permease